MLDLDVQKLLESGQPLIVWIDIDLNDSRAGPRACALAAAHTQAEE